MRYSRACKCFSEVYNPDGEITGYEADIMKILTVIILFLTMLMTGCSNSYGYKRSSWQQQMEDNRRIPGGFNERQDLGESNQANRGRH